MRLLDRYLLRQLLVPLTYCVLGFVIFWLGIELLTELDDFQGKALSSLQVANYFLLKIPEIIVVVLPIAFLLALLYALSHHARHHELTAMLAAGVGLWRICTPYLLVGFTLSLAVFGLNEWVVPQCSDSADAFFEGAAGTGSRSWVQNLNFLNERGRRIWRIRAYHLGTSEMLKLRVDWDIPGVGTRKLIAERAVRTNGVWTFYDVQDLLQPTNPDAMPLPRVTNVLAVAEFDETPDEIRSEIKVGRQTSFKRARRVQLSIQEILAYQRWHQSGLRERRFWLETLLHARLAEPWTCLVVVLIAIPFGARTGRRNVVVGVASSLLICFCFFTARELALALGAGGYVAAPVAAWLPNSCFSLIGVLLTRRLT